MPYAASIPHRFHTFPAMTLESIPTVSLSPLRLAEAEQFLDSQSTAHPFQFPQWAGPRSRVMIAREDGKIRWLGTFGVQKPLGRGFPWIRSLSANRGPVCDDHSLWEVGVEQAVEKMREEGWAHVDVVPEWIWPEKADHPAFANCDKWRCTGDRRTSLRLNVTAPEDDIFANFRKISRYEVRRAERLGTTVSAASTVAELDEFLSLYQRMATWKGFTPDPIDDLRRTICWLIASESRGALLMASAKGVLHGGIVIARCGQRCWYIWGANARDEHMTVGHILQWRALLWAKSHGCTEYDFGGYTPGATSGPAWFKEGFGGTVVHLVSSHRRVIEPKRYKMFRVFSKFRNWI